MAAVKEEPSDEYQYPVNQPIKKETLPLVTLTAPLVTLTAPLVTLTAPLVTPAPSVFTPSPPASRRVRKRNPGPTIDSPSDPSIQYQTAQSLSDSSSWKQLKDHITSSCFPSSEHPSLQQMWFSAVYTLYQETKRLKRVSPSTKYQIRKQHPVPVSIFSVAPATNNYFSPSSRSRMEEVFRVIRHPDPRLVEQLMSETGLTAKQIRNFFKNKRSRA